MRNRIQYEACCFERLEPRTLLSGNVFAGVTEGGDLRIRGDAGDNHILVETIEGGVRVTGLDGTSVNGLDSVELAGFDRNALFTMRRGDDTLDLIGFDTPGNLRIGMGRGADATHLFDSTVGGNLVVNGKRGQDILTRDQTSVGGDSNLRRIEVDQLDLAGVNGLFAGATGLEGQTGTDVMQVKLNQAIQMLQRPATEEQHMQAINEGMEAIITSNLVVLPTFDTNQTDPETELAFERFLQMSNELINGLTQHVNGGKKIGTEDTKAAAADARNFIQVLDEAMEVIGGITGANPNAPSDPNNLQSPTNQELLDANDEGGTVVDDVLGEVFSRQVRSPFFSILFPTVGTPQEQVIPFVLEPDEIAVVVKEIQGIKAVVTQRVIPVWVEPWFARARIVGFRTVWVWEFVPAEFIKTLTFRHTGDSIEVDSQIKVILERQLLHFWRFSHKDVLLGGTNTGGQGGQQVN